MPFKEKQLYHQIHPLKLFADISAECISLYLFWQHTSSPGWFSTSCHLSLSQLS